MYSYMIAFIYRQYSITGELTKKGYQQELANGRAIRKGMKQLSEAQWSDDEWMKQIVDPIISMINIEAVS